MNPALLIFLAMLIVLLLIDLWLLVTRGYKATVSAALYNLAKGFPITACVFGVFIGHLYWPNLDACMSQSARHIGETGGNGFFNAIFTALVALFHRL